MERRYSHAQGRAPGWLARDLRHSTIDGVLYTVMTGLVDASLPLFTLWALSTHARRDLAAGLIQILPIVIGCSIGLFTPLLVRRFQGYRLVTGLYAASQVVASVGLAAIALMPQVPLWVLFTVVSIYATGAYAGGSSWLVWSGCFIPERVRAHYIARRNYFLHMGFLAGVAVSAAALESASSCASTPDEATRFQGYAFATLFLLGGACRWISTWHLMQVPDAPEFAKQDRGLSLREIFTRLRGHSALRLLLFVALGQFAVQAANPHWAAFAKIHLGFRYAAYFSLFAAMPIGKILMNSIAGGICKRIGLRKTGILAMVMLFPVPCLWLLAGGAYVPMLLAQLLAGAGLAVFELTIYLMQLDHTEPHERSSLLSKVMLVNNGSGLLGTAMSGQLLTAQGGTKAFMTIFIAASALRLAAAIPLLRSKSGPEE